MFSDFWLTFWHVWSTFLDFLPTFSALSQFESGHIDLLGCFADVLGFLFDLLGSLADLLAFLADLLGSLADLLRFLANLLGFPIDLLDFHPTFSGFLPGQIMGVENICFHIHNSILKHGD
ncbi:hypothetical protein PU629_19100 [Pullulanibacillus sp. KACC 23026]|uniref:hypothetical protein n=1 Tax=Pullulanibacillus sp. KACC 23026 TaxID=3028315 RepID=UPI0023B18CEF|nr:hypothetical protein [Pullulanibacillus sp. KACC 23026]WEG12202.1 hypothetical protein PU629_19100 [Pullulanibacillus sp. KACC 23026]